MCIVSSLHGRYILFCLLLSFSGGGRRLKGKNTWVAKEDLDVIGYALESSKSWFDNRLGNIPKGGGRLETLSKSAPE